MNSYEGTKIVTCSRAISSVHKRRRCKAKHRVCAESWVWANRRRLMLGWWIDQHSVKLPQRTQKKSSPDIMFSCTEFLFRISFALHWNIFAVRYVRLCYPLVYYSVDEWVVLVSLRFSWQRDAVCFAFKSSQYLLKRITLFFDLATQTTVISVRLYS